MNKYKYIIIYLLDELDEDGDNMKECETVEANGFSSAYMYARELNKNTREIISIVRVQ